MIRTLPGLLVGVLLILFAQIAMTQSNRNCPDFATQAEAQAYFEASGGSAGRNVDGLDADRDGIACESLPPGTPGSGATPETAASSSPTPGTPVSGCAVNPSATPAACAESNPNVAAPLLRSTIASWLS